MSVSVPPTISVRALLFASYAEAVGRGTVALTLAAPATVRSALQQLRALPGGHRLPERPLVAVNQIHASIDSSLSSMTRSPCCLPSPEADVTYLTNASLDLGRLVSRVSAPGRGGIACFLGVVRDHQGGRAVESLDYSAYEPMAEAECARILAEARGRWQAEVALEHRLGHLAVGEAAVAIAAAAPHRDAAFAACRYVIDEVKRRVPIWKRERYADGTEVWVDPTKMSRGADERMSSAASNTTDADVGGSSDWGV